ncbi:MAG: hypothetical protein K6U14_01260 [Firmicutes bacterium]|nr:hypothetical protein [Alicyclobacillaceae bacterium]MCL6496247.1 hypothetical protein [Bacillota bacterium]
MRTTAVAALTLAAAGCGGPGPAAGPTPSAAPQHLVEPVLRAVSNWPGVDETFTETVALEGHPAQHYTVHLVEVPGRFRLTVAAPGASAITAQGDGHEVVWQSGASGLTVALPALAPSPDGFRWLGLALQGALRSASGMTATALGTEGVTLRWTGALPGAGTARCRLTFDVARGAPVTFSARFAGGRVEDEVTAFHTVRALALAPFPGGPTRPLDVAPAQGTTLLGVAAAAVHFPAFLPPPSAGLTLSHVDVPAGSTPAVLLLTYTAPDGSQILVSEGHGAVPTPPGAVATTVTENGWAVQEALLPRGEAWQAFSVGNTWVEAVGPADWVERSVADWLLAWGPGPAASGGAAPSA